MRTMKSPEHHLNQSELAPDSPIIPNSPRDTAINEISTDLRPLLLAMSENFSHIAECKLQFVDPVIGAGSGNLEEVAVKITAQVEDPDAKGIIKRGLLAYFSLRDMKLIDSTTEGRDGQIEIELIFQNNR